MTFSIALFTSLSLNLFPASQLFSHSGYFHPDLKTKWHPEASRTMQLLPNSWVAAQTETAWFQQVLVLVCHFILPGCRATPPASANKRAVTIQGVLGGDYLH